MKALIDPPKFERQDNETWRDVVQRIGKWAHVEKEVLEEFDFLASNMQSLDTAAAMALYEWDALPL